MNDRLRKHLLSLTKPPAGHLSLRIRGCHCTPYWDKVIVLTRHRGREAREVMEAYLISNIGHAICIGETSVLLNGKKMLHLGRESQLSVA